MEDFSTLNFKPAQESRKPKKEVLNFLLNYSKSLEFVHTSEIKDIALNKN
jgi:hypothetical protein